MNFQKISSFLLAVVCAVSLTACSSMNKQEKTLTGAGVGAVAGGVVGDALFGSTLGTVAGAAGGAIAGGAIGNHT